jgi:hypothetical protein
MWIKFEAALHMRSLEGQQDEEMRRPVKAAFLY